MRQILLIAALVATLPGLAAAEMKPGSDDVEAARKMVEGGTELGTSADQISEALAGLGFIVGGIESRDGHFVAKVTHGSAHGEVIVDGASGEVTNREFK